MDFQRRTFRPFFLPTFSLPSSRLRLCFVEALSAVKFGETTANKQFWSISTRKFSTYFNLESVSDTFRKTFKKIDALQQEETIKGREKEMLTICSGTETGNRAKTFFRGSFEYFRGTFLLAPFTSTSLSGKSFPFLSSASSTAFFLP